MTQNSRRKKGEETEKSTQTIKRKNKHKILFITLTFLTEKYGQFFDKNRNQSQL